MTWHFPEPEPPHLGQAWTNSTMIVPKHDAMAEDVALAYAAFLRNGFSDKIALKLTMAYVKGRWGMAA